jgi:hypothetical protein
MSVCPHGAPYEGRCCSVLAHKTRCLPACRPTRIVPRHHHKPFLSDSVAQRSGKRHEFDRALVAPVPWRQPVLRAVFACPRIPRSYGDRRLPIVADQRLKAVGTLTPSNELARPTLYPAPPSAQIPGWLCSNGEPCEQAHLPTEQPPSGQDPRLPPAYAYPGGSRNPGCSPRQGSLRTIRLRLDPCCRRVIVCEAAAISPQFSGEHAEHADLVQAAA